MVLAIFLISVHRIDLILHILIELNNHHEFMLSLCWIIQKCAYQLAFSNSLMKNPLILPLKLSDDGSNLIIPRWNKLYFLHMRMVILVFIKGFYLNIFLLLTITVWQPIAWNIRMMIHQSIPQQPIVMYLSVLVNRMKPTMQTWMKHVL